MRNSSRAARIRASDPAVAAPRQVSRGTTPARTPAGERPVAPDQSSTARPTPAAVADPVRAGALTVLASLLYAALLCGLTRVQAECTNVQSRLMTIKMLVEQRTLRLDQAPFVPVDHVTIGGHDYSDKPPVLPALGAIVYAGLHRLGYDLYGGDPRDKEYRRSRDHRFAVLVLTFALVGLSSAAAAGSFLRELVPLARDEATRLGLWMSFAFGTLFFSYSVELNNHVVAGAAVWAAFVLAFLRSEGQSVPGAAPAWGWAGATAAAVCGLCAGLALVIDPPAGGVFLPLLAWGVHRRMGAAPRRWRALVAFAAGSLLPLTLHCVLQPQVTGSVLPAQFYYPKYFPEALQAEAGPSDMRSRLEYTARILTGPCGLFWMTPTLLFCLPGLAHALRRGSAAEQRAAAATALASVVLVLYYGFLAPANHGGEAYGFRWFIAVTPIWYYFACVGYMRARFRCTRWVFWVCACWSIVAATSGAQAPWLREQGNWWLIGKVLG